jgi:hypothetical protein
MSYKVVFKTSQRIETVIEHDLEIRNNDLVVASIPVELFDYFFKLNRKRGKQFLSRIFQTLIAWHVVTLKPSLSEHYFEKNSQFIKLFTTPIWWSKQFESFMKELPWEHTDYWLS